MRIDVEMEEQSWFCEPDLDQFVDELKSAGFTIEIGDTRTKQSQGGYGIVGPESIIVIKIDPDTLRLLFEYSAMLVAVYKAHDYFGDFLKKVIEKLADKAGAKIAAIFSRFWGNLYKRIRSLAEKRPPKTVLRLQMQIEGLPVYATMQIVPSRVNQVSEQDQEQALGLLFYVVLPLLPELIRQSRSAGETPKAIHVTLAMPVSILDRFGPEENWRRGGCWHWHISIAPGRELIIDCHSQRKDKTSPGSK